MSVESSLEEGVLNIMVSGRFEFSVHPHFRDLTRLAENGVKQIVIDLAKTDYVDSSALAMLLVLRDKFVGDKNSIQINNAQNDIKEILEMANFTQLFKMG